MRVLSATLAVACVGVIPSAAFAQATIAGIVRDTSGGVLPGVTVEAASPALIEKARAVVTDATGRYRIVDLRPGSYAVTFALPGFSTVKREGIELTGSFTATVNAELRVGALEETITVTGETPVVDVQSTTRQRVFDHEVIDSIPTAKNQYNLAVLIPGISMGGGNTQQDVGGSAGLEASYGVVVHGSKLDSQRISQNGVTINTFVGGGYGGSAAPNPAAVQEITIDYSGVSTDLATGGVRINLIPREGGNAFSGTIFGSFANDTMQGSNLSEDLKARGLQTPNSVKAIWDFNPGIGGPLQRDTLWFYTSIRLNAAMSYVGGMSADRNANNPAVWTFDPDPSRPASTDNTWKAAQGRVTWQASSRNKIALSYDQQHACYCPNAVTATQAQEASRWRRFPLQRSFQADWTSPLNSRLLLEAVAFHRVEMPKHDPMPGMNLQMISVTEQGGTVPGLTYRANSMYFDNWNWSLYYRGAVSYVTGAHALKVGFNNGIGAVGPNRTYALQPISYRLNNGVPNQITLIASPFSSTVDIDSDLGLYVQDRWTIKRLTLTLGVRYDYFANSFPEQHVGAAALAPDRNITFPRQDNLRWHDITPKSGAAYDLFGNGGTAVKVMLNKYLQGMLSGLGAAPNPVSTLVNTTTRAWTDANRNYIPDCDLASPAAQDNRGAGGDFCAAMANANFGKTVPGSTFDPEALRGFGKRNYNWEFSAGLQQKIATRASVDVSYFRRWYGNFTVTDNLTIAPSDFDAYTITAPADPRLPNGGGDTIAGLFDLRPDKFGLPARNYVTLSDSYGKQIEHWNGIDVTASARFSAGALVQGGLSTGRTTTDTCDVVEKVDNPSTRFCHVDTNFLTQVKLLGAYVVRPVDVQVSATFQSIPGPEIAAQFVAASAVIAPSLGRNLSGNAANVTVNLVEPGALYGARLQQLDVRFSKTVRFGRSRASFSLDLYNALNASPVLSFNNNYAAWLRPTSILPARLAKVGAQLDF
jgi:hypothetical protein